MPSSLFLQSLEPSIQMHRFIGNWGLERQKTEEACKIGKSLWSKSTKHIFIWIKMLPKSKWYAGDTELAQKFVRAFLYYLMENPKWTFLANSIDD